MSHLHNVIDDDLHFIINPDTRAISRASEIKPVLIQGDHNSERFTFDIPKTVDGHDLTQCNLVRIHFINISAENKDLFSPGIYEVTDLTNGSSTDTSEPIYYKVELDFDNMVYVETEEELEIVSGSPVGGTNGITDKGNTVYLGKDADGNVVTYIVVYPTNPNTLSFSWLLEKEATVYVGTLNFIVEFICKTDNVIDYAWHTAVCKEGAIISEGLDNSEVIIGEYYDTLDKWIALIEVNGTAEINKAREEIVEEKDRAVSVIADVFDRAEEEALGNIDKRVTEVKADLTAYGMSVSDAVVQETGQSTDKVMSQKAVSDEMDALSNSVNTSLSNMRAEELEYREGLQSDVIDAMLVATHSKVDPSDESEYILSPSTEYIVINPNNTDKCSFSMNVNLTVCNKNEVQVYEDVSSIFSSELLNSYDTIEITNCEFKAFSRGVNSGTNFFLNIKYKINSQTYTESIRYYSDVNTTYVAEADCTSEFPNYTVVFKLVDESKSSTVYSLKTIATNSIKFNITATGIDSVTTTKNTTGTNTIKIILTDGTEKTFEVKDGVGISDIELYNHGDYDDTYRIILTDGNYTYFNVPNNNSVGIVTKDSGEMIHARDLIPLEHTIKTKVRTKNLWNYKPNTEINGVTITTDENGRITFNGTCSKSFVIYEAITLEPGTYTLSDNQDGDKPTTIDARTQIYIPSTGLDARIEHHHASDKTVTFTLPERSSDVRLRIKGAEGFTYSNYSIAPQLEEGNTATPYTPYIDVSTVKLTKCGKNLIPYPYVYGSGTIAGITYTNNGDGTITANGTATDSSIQYMVTNPRLHLAPGTYTLSGCPAGGSQSTYRVCIKAPNEKYYYDTGNGITFTLTEDNMVQMYVFVGNGISVDNLKFKPQLEVGDTATSFEIFEGTSHSMLSEGVPVNRITSLSPITNLISDKEGVIIDATYNVDQSIVYNELATIVDAATWDLIITEEKLTDTTLQTLLNNASGRVFVKAIDNSTTINVPSAIKLIEFAPSVELEGVVSITGNDDDSSYLDDCQVIRGATSRCNRDDLTDTTLPTIRNFKGGVEHCHGDGWFFKNCNNIEHCSYLRIENCHNINHCNIGKYYGDGRNYVCIIDCSNIEDLYTTNETEFGWKFENCKFIRDIVTANTTGSVSLNNCNFVSNMYNEGSGGISFTDCKFIRDIHSEGGCYFANCEHISNIGKSSSGYSVSTYNNCLYVDPYTCANFLELRYIGQNRKLTDDGTFSAPYVE